MTSISITYNEHHAQTFNDVVPAAQEASIPKKDSTQSSTRKEADDIKGAFLDVVPKAQEGNRTRGSIPAMNYSDKGGTATYTHNKFKVAPSLSDFLVDVQNTARKRLEPHEYSYFMRTYFGTEYLGIADMSDPRDLDAQGRDRYFTEFLHRKYKPEDHATVSLFDQRIRQKLGKAFNELGIAPYSTYMNQDDNDVRKRFEQ